MEGTATEERSVLPVQLRVPHRPFRESITPGTVVVRLEQVRSAIRLDQRRKGTLRALGLHGLGSVAFQPDRLSTWGAITRVSHLLHITKVVWSASTPPSRHHRPGAPVMTSVPYRMGEHSGTRVDTPSGASVYIERYGEQSSVTWPTRITAADLLEKARKVLDLSGVQQTEIWGQEDGPVELPPDEMIRFVRKDQHRVEVVRIEDTRHDRAIVWQRVLGDPDGLEVSVVGTLPDPQTLRRLMGMTASASVQKVSHKVSQEIDAALEFGVQEGNASSAQQQDPPRAVGP